jgi:glycosyltransferase involved in cell wall biosynthesis
LATGAFVPKVSVIIPAYNEEKYIKDSINCIVHQTLKELQIICVNDGSKDNTLDIIKQFALKDRRIVIINQNNQGLSAARNIGLSAAKGEYIYFLDSDDLLEETALETLYDHAKKTNAQNVLFDAVTIFESKELEQSFSQFKELYLRKHDYPGMQQGGELLCKMIQNTDYVTPVWIQFFERKFLQENNLCFKKGIIHEDELFTLQAMSLCQRAIYLKLNLYRRRIRKGSIMTEQNIEKSFAGLYICFVEMIRFMLEHQSLLSADAFHAIWEHLLIIHRRLIRFYRRLKSNQRQEPSFVQSIFLLLSPVLEVRPRCS